MSKISSSSHGITVWKNKWPDEGLFTHSWAVTDELARWSGTWKEHDWKFDEKHIWERSLWIDLSKWAKNVQILVSYLNVHQKKGVQLSWSSIIRYIGWPILWTVCLFPQPFLSLLIGHMNKAAMVTDIGVIHGLNNMDFHSQSLVRLQLPLSHRYGTSS